MGPLLQLCLGQLAHGSDWDWTLLGTRMGK